MKTKLLYFLTIFIITFAAVLVSLSWTPQALVDVVVDDFAQSEATAPVLVAQGVSPKVLGVSTVRKNAPIAKALPQPIRVVPTRREGAPRLTLVDAHAAVVLDADSGAVLYDQKATTPRAIASLTKLYTAYLVRSSGIAMDAPVTITEEMLQVVGSRVGCKNSYTCAGERLRVGEVISVESLLSAMLITSANDAAKALAIAVSGSEGVFVKLMNDKAREMGLAGTNFCTPNGLEDDDAPEKCVASAMNIAQIARKTINDKLIWSLLNTPEKTIYSIDGSVKHKLKATNRFVRTAEVDKDAQDIAQIAGEEIVSEKGSKVEKMPNMIGAKTGFTPLAGYSVLLSAKHPDVGNDARVVAVILGDYWRWRDIKTLINWTFDSYIWNSHKYKTSLK